MSTEITRINVADIPAYAGPHEIPGIRFKHARQALGVTAWGMNVLEFDPNADGYPRHDHTADGQEEVYVVLEGSLVFHTADDTMKLSTGDVVRVPADVERWFTTGDESARILALGGTPNKAYEVGTM